MIFSGIVIGGSVNFHHFSRFWSISVNKGDKRDKNFSGILAITITEINLGSLCCIKISKISLFLYLSSYGKAFKMVEVSRCTII